jgi:hypothetical protein
MKKFPIRRRSHDYHQTVTVQISPASIEEQAVIEKILNHLMKKGALPPPPELLPATRASPILGWFV